MDSPLERELEIFRRKYRAPAVAACVAAHGKEDVLGATGVGRMGSSRTVDRESVWHIGSCLKSMTAALYARLVERGEARWGTPLPDIFEDLASAAHPDWSHVTIDDVLRHRSGLPANLTRKALLASYEDDTPVREQRTRVAASSLASAPRRRGRFVYSNLGYIIAGAAIETITGIDYEGALHEHVLEPLGITTAGFGPPEFPTGHQRPALALGPLVLGGRGKPRPVDPKQVRSDNPAVMGPAGRMYLSLSDWARFQKVFHTETADFLSRASIDHLLMAGEGAGPPQAMGWSIVNRSNISFGQQGSNTFWVATAVTNKERLKTAMVVSNDGSPRLLRASPRFAMQLLGDD